MIGKVGWFKRRQYSGWGLTPKTWQGFAYVGLLIASVWLMNQMFPPTIAFGLTVGFVVIFTLDILHIMSQVKLDERERTQEALAERNASWAMVAGLALALVYVNTFLDITAQQDIMPILIGILMTGLVAKAATGFFLKQKGF